MENQINIGDQNTQQIEQNLINQPPIQTVPEKPRFNYWMISIIIVFFALVVGGISYLFSQNRSYSKNRRLQQKVRKNPTSIPSIITEKSISAYILGIRNNKLTKFKLKDGSFEDLNIIIDPKWTYRISPDKKKIFISTYELYTKISEQTTFYIYSLDGEKLYEGKPQLGDGYDTLGLQYSDSFGKEYFAWDNKSNGILYMVSGTISKVTYGIGETRKIQFRYISLFDKSDSILYEEQKDYGETEETISGYIPDENIVIRSFIGAPGIITNAYTINIKTKVKQDILTFETNHTHLEKKISPDGKFVVGIVPNFDASGQLKKENPYSVIVKSITDPKQQFDLSSLVKYYPEGQFLNSGGDILFVDNQTVAALQYKGDELSRIDFIDFLNSKIVATIAPKELDQSRFKIRSLERIIFINNGNILTDKRVITDSSEYYLPENFIPIAIY